MRNLYTAAVLVAAMAAGTAHADADDTYVTGNLYFNENGFAGYGIKAGINDFEMHASRLTNLKYAVGVGLVVADSEDRGEAGNDKVGISASLGFAIVGAGDGVRPYGAINSELDLSGDAIATVGGINYGLGLMDTDAYVYTGLGVQSLVNNLPVDVAATRSAGDDTGDTGTGDTGTGDTGGNGEDPGTGGDDSGTGGDDPGTGGGGSGNPNDDKDDDPNDGNAGIGNDGPCGKGGGLFFNAPTNDGTNNAKGRVCN